MKIQIALFALPLLLVEAMGADTVHDEPEIQRRGLRGGKDSHGCISSAGYTWCKYSQKCIRPWEEHCRPNPVFKGPVTLECEQDSFCYSNDDNQIEFDMGSWTMGAFYIDKLDAGTYDLMRGSNASCSGCKKAKLIGGEKDEHGCLVAAGETWCPPLQKCIRAWEEKCYV